MTVEPVQNARYKEHPSPAVNKLSPIHPASMKENKDIDIQVQS